MVAAANLPTHPVVIAYKNNSDGKGNSYGCHENYLMDRQVPFANVVAGVIPHFVTRQIFTGAGKVGTETTSFGSEQVRYQISQRAEFFEEMVGLETTLKRPIVNTRDEPHADPKRFRRLHVIVGDANLAEVATFLKVGTTSVVLAMIEDDMLPYQGAHPEPTRSGRCTRSRPTSSLSRPLRTADGSTITAARDPVGDLRRGPSVRQGTWVSRSSVASRWARWSSIAGRRCSTASRPTPRPSSTNWTGWPSATSSRPTGTATAAAGTTTGWPPSTCSTTTCVPSGPCSPGSPWSAW